jgi:hypothetical protein
VFPAKERSLGSDSTFPSSLVCVGGFGFSKPLFYGWLVFVISVGSLVHCVVFGLKSQGPPFECAAWKMLLSQSLRLCW